VYALSDFQVTTEHYVNEGPWLLRGVEYRDGYIDFDALISVEQYKYDEQPQIHLQYEDIAMTKDGTIGKALAVPELTKQMAAGSTIARLRLKNRSKLSPYYLEFVINHPIVQIQVQSFATGLAQPHITQEWIAQLIIPRLSNIESEISNYIANHHYLMEKAHILTKEAKSQVESLIEGTLETEAILSGKLKAPTWQDIEKELEEI
jgi:type I restriction enzyme S subunit